MLGDLIRYNNKHRSKYTTGRASDQILKARDMVFHNATHLIANVIWNKLWNLNLCILAESITNQITDYIQEMHIAR